MSAHQVLSADAHRELRVRTERAPELGDGVMCCLAVPSEFRQVQNEFPILFRLDQERDNFTALAMFGFETGENLFLDGGRWDARYRPLSLEIQPFMIGVPAGGSNANQVHIDLQSRRIGDEEGVRVFDDGGRPTPYLEAVIEKLGALDAGFQASADFFSALGRHKLLEPMTLEIMLEDGSKNRVVGFHAIDEDRLRALDAAALGELHAAGHLMPIFMAIASLANIGDLVARKNRGLRRG
jgi:hypothetical protein